MHEYSLAENLIQSILETLGAEHVDSSEAVKELTIRVGVLELHSEESFRQAFKMRSTGTLLEKAKLNLEIIPGSICCEACDRTHMILPGEADVHAAMPVVPCPECGIPCVVRGGRGIQSLDVDVEQYSGV
jgi:hydrogenase nickel incorporation protein HypA/HybF